MGWIHGDENAYLLGFGSSEEKPSRDPASDENFHKWSKACELARTDFMAKFAGKAWSTIAVENPGFVEFISDKSGENLSPLDLDDQDWNPIVLANDLMEFKKVPLPRYADFSNDCVDF